MLLASQVEAVRAGVDLGRLERLEIHLGEWCSPAREASSGSRERNSIAITRERLTAKTDEPLVVGLEDAIGGRAVRVGRAAADAGHLDQAVDRVHRPHLRVELGIADEAEPLDSASRATSRERITSTWLATACFVDDLPGRVGPFRARPA